MSNTRETISLKTIIMTQNITKRQGKRKGKDTCDAFFPLSFVPLFLYSSSLSRLSLFGLGRRTQKKKAKKKGGRSSSASDGSWIFFF